MKFVNERRLIDGLTQGCVIDDFLNKEYVSILDNCFPLYSDPRWFVYDNPIENKKTCCDWGQFQSPMYQLFRELNSLRMVAILANHFKCVLHSDPGLHGGGMHIHGAGGNLNPHLDYEIHPKLGLKRYLNIIIYLSDTKCSELGFWADDDGQCGALSRQITIRRNRAVIFQTENCWHGMARPMEEGSGLRKSLAVYYLTDTDSQDGNKRARFALREDQVADTALKQLISDRCKL
jgi:hypothetical protein